jgi:hypothetical protein
MATNIVPVMQVDQMGIVLDTPSVSIPPNAFSDARNVRFKDGSISKVSGSQNISVTGLVGDIVYSAFWDSVLNTNGYYIVVTNDTSSSVSRVYVAPHNGGAAVELTTTSTINASWNHTVFQGGYKFILNNQQETPWYISEEGLTINDITIYSLPGWEGYYVNQELVNETYNASNTSTYDLGVNVNFTNYNLGIYVERLDDQGDPFAVVSLIAETRTDSELAVEGITINPPSTSSGTTLITFASPTTLLDGDTVVITLQSVNPAELTAGVIRSYGNILVAGNLEEKISGETLRAMPNVVRTSDIAQPGAIPHNWNPFAVGVNSADEFILSSGGIVKDLVELQGTLFIYTDNSIFSLRPTGNTSIPYATAAVTNSYGIERVNTVLEYDGKHLVIGTDDIYVFSGHPANIQSLCQARVRKDFFKNYNRSEPLEIVRYPAKDEIWICYYHGSTPTALVWDYRQNVWSKRDIPEFSNVSLGYNRKPVFSSTALVEADVDDKYTDENGDGYSSYIEKKHLPVTPDHKIESVKSLVLHAYSDNAATVYIHIDGTNTLSSDIDLSFSYPFEINTADPDYKADIRATGRYLSFNIGDEAATEYWSISGFQIEIKQGGAR